MKHPVTYQSEQHFYENPVLAYYGDCLVPIQAERFVPKNTSHMKIVEKRLQPTQVNIPVFYMRFMDFLKEAIALQKCRKIFLAGGESYMAHIFEIPQIMYLNLDTRQVGRLHQGQWWVVNHRKIGAIAILSAESTIYDNRFQDMSEKVSAVDMVNIAKDSSEVVIVCVIRRGFGETDITPAILVDEVDGSERTPEEVLSQSDDDSDIVFFDEPIFEAPKRDFFQVDPIRTSKLCGEVNVRFNVENDQDWTRHGEIHAGPLTAIEDQIALVDKHCVKLQDRMDLCRLHYAALSKLKDQYDTWVSYTSNLVIDHPHPEELLRNPHHVQETGDVLGSICKQFAKIACRPESKAVEMAALLAPLLAHKFCERLMDEASHVDKKISPVVGGFFESVCAKFGRNFLFEDLCDHAIKLLEDLHNAPNYRQLMPLVAAHVAEKLGMCVLCCYTLDDGKDPKANRWSWRHQEGDKLMQLLKESLPANSPVVAFFCECFVKLLHNEPLDSGEIPKLQLLCDYTLPIISEDGFLAKQWAAQQGKEYKLKMKIGEIYKTELMMLKQQIENTTRVLAAKNEVYPDNHMWSDVIELHNAQVYTVLENFQGAEGFDPDAFLSVFEDLRIVAECLKIEEETDLKNKEQSSHIAVNELAEKRMQLLAAATKAMIQANDTFGSNEKSGGKQDIRKVRTARGILYSGQNTNSTLPHEMVSIKNLIHLCSPMLHLHEKMMRTIQNEALIAKNRGTVAEIEMLKKAIDDAETHEAATVGAVARYVGLFLHLKCVPRKHKRDVLEKENDLANSVHDTYDRDKEFRSAQMIKVQNLDDAQGGPNDEDVLYYLDMLINMVVDELKYDQVSVKLLNDIRRRVVQLKMANNLVDDLKRYAVPGFQVTQLTDVPRELFIVVAVMLSWCVHQNVESEMLTVKETLDVLADHCNAFLLDIVWCNNKRPESQDCTRALTELWKAASRNKTMIAGSTKTVLTSSVVIQAYEHSMGLRRCSLKKQIPMMDHYFKHCTKHQILSSGLSLEDRETAVISALALGTMYRLQTHAGTLPEIVDWIHLNVARSTNRPQLLVKKFLVYLTSQLDVLHPMGRMERGRIIGTISGLLDNANNQNAAMKGSSVAGAEAGAEETREIAVAEAVVSMHELAKYLYMVSASWRKKVSAKQFLDTDGLSEGFGENADNARVLDFVRLLACNNLGITHTMMRVVDMYLKILKYPCCVSSDGEPLYIIARNPVEKQFQAFLLLTRDFLFAEECGQMSQTAVEACLVCLQNVGLQLAGRKFFQLKLNWIHLIISQELQRMKLEDFPFDFERLASKVSMMVAFMIPESIRGGLTEDEDIVERVHNFIKDQEKYILEYMDHIYVQLEIAKTSDTLLDIEECFETYMEKIQREGIDYLQHARPKDGEAEDAIAKGGAGGGAFARSFVDPESGKLIVTPSVLPDGATRPVVGASNVNINNLKDFEAARKALNVAAKMAVPQEFVPLRVACMCPDDFRKVLTQQITGETT